VNSKEKKIQSTQKYVICLPTVIKFNQMQILLNDATDFVANDPNFTLDHHH
jgi:hypothetical protein